MTHNIPIKVKYRYKPEYKSRAAIHTNLSKILPILGALFLHLLSPDWDGKYYQFHEISFVVKKKNNFSRINKNHLFKILKMR